LRDEKVDKDNDPKGTKGIDNILATLIWLAIAVWPLKSRRNPPKEKADESDHEIAEWTKVVARWTRGLVFVGGITAVVLGAQFCVLWRTDQIFRDIDRAFLASYEVRINKNGDGEKATWEISPFLENAGNTSAVKIRSRIARFYDSPIYWPMRRVNIRQPNPDTSEYEFDGLPEASMSLAPRSKIALGAIVIKKTLGKCSNSTL
jgi:hypothetical protein